MHLSNPFHINKGLMNKFRNVVFVIASVGFILACSVTSAAPTQIGSISTVVAATLHALTPAIPEATQPAPPQIIQSNGIPVTFQNVSFVIPNGLASGASSQAVPNNPTDQTGGPWAVAPAHIEFTLNSYNLPPGYFSQILIDVYPAQDYAAMYDGAKISLQRLQAVLSNPSAPMTNDSLPQVPYFNAASMFVAQVNRIQFKNGSGVRMITQYGQAVGPVTNNGTFYHFEGLTNDGKYYVVAVLPIEASFLANGNDPNATAPAGGIPFPGYNYTDPTYYENYFQAVSSKMDGTAPEAFLPSLAVLDALIQSLQISP